MVSSVAVHQQYFSIVLNITIIDCFRAAQELVERHILTLIEMGKMVEEKIKR